ncbi:hypothetical protein D6D15_04929 [Aureobasidium pullulans]|uniref:DUF1665 domain-containing protein n=1 Tax=Aureobasidium pullulans TaxID=5580 RepID=A0A4V4IVM2_AURPU|nr:hypothetical protein D6D15_04929 [Aureobasidium pullulans]
MSSSNETRSGLADNLKCHHFYNNAGERVFPGWGMELNLNQTGPNTCPHHHLVEEDPTSWMGTLLAVREVNMIVTTQKLMEKPEWFRKVHDETICAKWMSEVMSQVDDFSELMWEYCVAELRDKAKTLEETGIVAPIDVDSQVVYSDTAISESMRKDLNRAIASLENVPDKHKDWHPRTRERVLDLVHPSLFPLVYGRSRVLKEGTVGLEDCMSYCGKGEVVETPVKPFSGGWSDQFQWLPCDVEFRGEEEIKIVSYINNLHPKEYPGIYRLVEKVIAKAVPLWDQVLSHTGGGPYEHNGIKRSREFVRPFKPRVEINDFRHEWLYGEYRPTGWTLGRLPETAEEKAELQSCADAFDYRNWEKRHKDESLEREQGVDVDELEEWWRENMRVLHMPEPKPYAPREIPEEPSLDLRKEYADSGLQIIVKLANTYLSPDDPEWEGGSWHVEGLSNEHIVATAIYYFSNTNITPSHLKFRQNGSDESWFDMEYEQGDYAHLEKITGFINDQDNLVQSLGSVLCKEGRLLAFPNVLQHNVGSFKLENSTKPGERKILALFLVDPHVRILSTSKVPPQQKHWWEKDLREKREGIEKLNTLPNELMEKVFEDVRDFPISMDEAKEIREDLMEERGPIGESMIECEAQFFFCEH